MASASFGIATSKTWSRHCVDADGTPLPEDDLERIVERLQSGHEAPVWVRYQDANVKVEAMHSTDVPRRFDFVATPGA